MAVTGLIVKPYCGGCGAPITALPFHASVDEPRPAFVPTGTKAGHTGFPLSLAQTDPDVLLLFIDDIGYDYSFTLDLSWVAAGKSGHTTLTDNGKPFEVFGARGLPTYDEVPPQGKVPGFTNDTDTTKLILAPTS